MSDVDQDTLLAELEKENKILEEELEMIMKQNMGSKSLSKSKRSNASEAKQKNLQKIDEEEMYAYSNSECENFNDSIDEEEMNSTLFNQHINQRNKKFTNQQLVEEIQRKQPQPIPQDSMKMINSLFQHQENKESQINSPNSGSALLYSPISSMKKTKSVPKGLTINTEYSQQMQRAITPQNARVSFTERNNSKDRFEQSGSTQQVLPSAEMNLNGKFKNFDNCENIMGISNRAGGLSYDFQEENQKNLQQSMSKTTGKQSQSSPKKEKIQSLEMRLSGTQKAVKELEKQIRQKDLQIKELNLEILKKNKEIEKLTQNSSSQQIQNSQSARNLQVQTSISDYVKKEKQLEKKIKDQETQINDFKKNYSRVQEVNSSLLIKIKDLEKDIEIYKQQKGGQSIPSIEGQTCNASYQNENTDLRKKIKYLEKCLEEKEIDYDYLQKQHEALIELSTEHLLKSENLYDAYSNIQQILQVKR
ncbi:hypothetical protein TTHERM_00192010 (macronuclear) [Tetrahymena thermophila SB210]|uniref:Uncharacterized protein n=1 Tax=Tetrahymena thermophila (strain SB210) TaxID=312017 RepID=I7M1K8_TETTS|nr:hypothetical protein TTHERM_00192010 [Tetrahymena thermophila SB210]EAR96532.3 hypothetical protein TTHERM_00192010 [Tetrahymena thermophila SB210]|eukprot:XP_001016777.3 hypothetical protein TTHERM_00192010 [Tetrahymena thermophila SB210]